MGGLRVRYWRTRSCFGMCLGWDCELSGFGLGLLGDSGLETVRGGIILERERVTTAILFL